MSKYKHIVEISEKIRQRYSKFSEVTKTHEVLLATFRQVTVKVQK